MFYTKKLGYHAVFYLICLNVLASSLWYYITNILSYLVIGYAYIESFVGNSVYPGISNEQQIFSLLTIIRREEVVTVFLK